MAANDPPEGAAQQRSISEPKVAVIDLENDAIEWALFETIADLLDLDPRKDDIPIDEHIDPDAMRDLFTEHSGETYISFPVWDMRVCVHSDGYIKIRPEID